MGKAHEPFAPACQCLVPQVMGDWADVFRQAASVIAPL